VYRSLMESRNFFVWTVALGKILTMENLIRWGLIVVDWLLYVEKFL
jgi:hypothetical protein